MDNKEAVKRLLLLLGRYKKTIVVIVGCLLVSTGLNLCVPLISRRIMDDGFIGGNLHYKFPHRYSQGKETCRYFSKDTIFSLGTVFFTSYEAAGKLFQ